MRIAIIGKPGSGKSTFASVLAKKLNLPLYHLDKIFFVENWQYRPYFDFLDEQQDWCDEDSWIIDGNSLQSLNMRYERATMVVYFNYPLWLCYWRIIKRIFRPNPEIDDLPKGCSKNLSWRLITYLWGHEKRINPLLKVMREIYPDVPFLEIKSDKELEKFSLHLFEK